MNDLERSLGRVEGKQDQILSELKALRDSLREHLQHDDVRFDLADKRMAVIEAEANRAKGAGKVIIAGFLGLCGFVGSVAMSIINGWVKISS